MKSPHVTWVLGLIGLSAALASACRGPSAPVPAIEPADRAATPEPAASRPAPRPVTPTPKGVDGSFAPAPRRGWIIRSTCRMGGCAWSRFDEVQRSGPETAPGYRLRITEGDSRHPGEYPLTPEGVAIEWDASAQPAEVRCSRTEPYAAVGGRGAALKLNPGGVFGVEQGLANLYFATCHGEYGDDGMLAAGLGYNLREP